MIDFDKVITDMKQLQFAYVDGPTKREMYELHKADPNRYSLTFLATKYKMSQERVKAILVLMKRQDAAVQRGEEIPGLQNQVDAFVAQYFQELRAQGVDTSFKEVQAEKPVKYRRRLYGDDEQEKELERLKRAVEKATQAKALESEVRDLSKRLQPDYKPEVPENRAAVEVVDKSRWKFALRDTTPGLNKPTLIRDKDGQFRPATAVEEYRRSWTENLSATDFEWEMHMQEVKSGEVATFKDKQALTEWYRKNTEKWVQIRAEDKKEFDAAVKALEEQVQQQAEGKKGKGKKAAAAAEDEDIDEIAEEAEALEDGKENPTS
jgi:multidrug efflux pump subunit AcrB